MAGPVERAGPRARLIPHGSHRATKQHVHASRRVHPGLHAARHADNRRAEARAGPFTGPRSQRLGCHRPATRKRGGDPHLRLPWPWAIRPEGRTVHSGSLRSGSRRAARSRRVAASHARRLLDGWMRGPRIRWAVPGASRRARPDRHHGVVRGRMRRRSSRSARMRRVPRAWPRSSTSSQRAGSPTTSVPAIPKSFNGRCLCLWPPTSTAMAPLAHCWVGSTFRAHLPAFRMPVAIVVGEEDYATPVEMARRLHDAIPQSTLTVLPRGRHLTPIEHPDAITSELRALLERARAHRK